MHFAFSLTDIVGETPDCKPGAAIACDADGNTYITGYFYGLVDFDPGPAEQFMSDDDNQYGYLAKYDPNGGLVWVVPLADTPVYGWAVAVDVDGNAYVTGEFFGTGDFNPGAGVTELSVIPYNSNNVSHSNVFASKFTTDGEFVWAKGWGSDGYCFGRGIAVDADGSVVTTGDFRGTVDFDPGTGVFEIENTGHRDAENGDPDVFISKLDSNGDFVWAKSVTHFLFATDVAVDSANNILVCGQVYNYATVDFDPGAGVESFDASNGNSGYIFKLNTNGDFVWARTFEHTQNRGGTDIIPRGISVDYEDNVIAAGEFQLDVDFDPGPGQFVENSTESSLDIFALKLDSEGNFQWVRHTGTTKPCAGNDVAVDNLGNIFLTGSFQDTIDFGFGAADAASTSAGEMDIYVMKLTGAGDYDWHLTVGGPMADWARGICVDPQGTPSITGTFRGIAAFPPEDGGDGEEGDDQVEALSKAAGGSLSQQSGAALTKKLNSGSVRGDLVSRFGRPKNLRPVAVIDNSGPTLLAPGGTVDFSGAGSFDPDGELMTYVWDFDNGNREELGAGGAFPPTETFTSPGRYASKLQVIDRLTKRSFVASSDVVVVGDNDDSQLYAKSAKFSVDRVRPDNDRFAIKGALNRRYLPADLSGVALSIDLEGVAAGGPVTLDAKGGFKAPTGTGGITAVKLASKNGAYSIALSATDLSSILPVPDVSAKGLLGIAVTLHLSGGGLAAPYDLEGRFEFKFASKKGQKASGSYSFTRNPSMSGTFLGTSVKAKADKAGTGFTVTAKGAFKPVGNQLPAPTDDVTVEIGTQSVTLPQAQVLVGSDGSLSFSNNSGAADTLKSLQLTVKSGKFSLQSNVLTGTGLPADPTGAVLLIRITVPTTFGDLTYETEAQL
ncbi:MAG: PKD domain-containing protein [Planctomycetes bacterium]|nr:PKD domain-containing protein [Planctomycetota bacterium]